MLLHDGVGAALASSSTPLGDEVSAKGTPSPFVAPPTQSWSAGRAALGNFTYRIDTGEPALVILATGPEPHAEAGTVVVRGTVALRAPHPDGSGRTLLVLRDAAWATPIFFR
ncbi:MAG: hypothetical protein AABX89_02465 [Candidatus Thermoplasmatota archaeon]